MARTSSLSMNARFVLASLALAGAVAVADQSASQKAEQTTHDTVRKVKKMGHHAEEAVCAEGDAKCAAKKAKHRAEEGSDYVKDKAQEAADKVKSDTESK